MNQKAMESVKRAIWKCLESTDFSVLASARGLSSEYVADQIAALVGELASVAIDAGYVEEKIENVRKQIQNVLAT